MTQLLLAEVCRIDNGWGQFQTTWTTAPPYFCIKPLVDGLVPDPTQFAPGV